MHNAFNQQLQSTTSAAAMIQQLHMHINSTSRVRSVQDFICQDESVEEGPVGVGSLCRQHLAQHISRAGGLQLDCKVSRAIVHPVLWLKLLQHPNYSASDMPSAPCCYTPCSLDGHFTGCASCACSCCHGSLVSSVTTASLCCHGSVVSIVTSARGYSIESSAGNICSNICRDA